MLSEVALVAAADEIEDESGAVALMTLHTAKGLEYDAVFITGVEEDLLPHRMSAGEPGGPQEERRLFYVGITRARRVLHLSLAASRTQYGETQPAMPSRYLQEIPAELIQWRQSPGDVTSRGGTRPRALNARFPQPDRGAFPPPSSRPKQKWANEVTGRIRDNSGMRLGAGDRIRHIDFGDGTVRAMLGTEKRRIAEVDFDRAGRKKLLVNLAPIEKLDEEPDLPR